MLDYRIVQLIGGGGFSKVFRAVNPSSKSNPVAAIKVISYAPNRSNKYPIDRRALQKEVQVHSILKHPNVLEFLGAVERGVDKNGNAGKEKGILMGEAVATTQESIKARDKERQKMLSTPSHDDNYVPGLYMVLELGAGGDSSTRSLQTMVSKRIWRTSTSNNSSQVSNTSTRKELHIAISNRRTCFSTPKETSKSPTLVFVPSTSTRQREGVDRRLWIAAVYCTRDEW